MGLNNTYVAATPGLVKGVAIINGYNCFIQTRGPCAVLTEGVLKIGDAVTPHSADGSVVAIAADGSPAVPVVGRAMTVSADGKWALVYLELE